jgi:general secretion pathway protein A
LFQCFLLGQPQFRRMMAAPDMEQLRQRVIASCHLAPLDADEVRDYVEHRLLLTGWQADPVFTDDAFVRIAAHTGGVPRRINTLCTRILLYGSLEELHRVDAAVVEQVAQELALEGTQHSSFAQPAAAVADAEAESDAEPEQDQPRADTPRLLRAAAPVHEETILDLKERVRVLRGGR